jgi:hypothetical protein
MVEATWRAKSHANADETKHTKPGKCVRTVKDTRWCVHPDDVSIIAFWLTPNIDAQVQSTRNPDWLQDARKTQRVDTSTPTATSSWTRTIPQPGTPIPVKAPPHPAPATWEISKAPPKPAPPIPLAQKTIPVREPPASPMTNRPQTTQATQPPTREPPHSPDQVPVHYILTDAQLTQHTYNPMTTPPPDYETWYGHIAFIRPRVTQPVVSVIQNVSWMH